MRTASRFSLVAAATLAAAFGSYASARAQDAAPVRIAVVQELNGIPGKALILRAPGEVDVVVLKATDANAEALGAALDQLLRLRVSAPAPQKTRLMALQGYAAYPWKNKGAERVLTSMLHKLSREPLVNIGNLGQGRWIEIPDARVKI